MGYYLSIFCSCLTDSHVSGENMQVSALTMPGMFCTPLPSLSTGSDTVSGNFGLFVVVISLSAQLPSVINISTRKIIMYHSIVLFILIIYVNNLECDMVPVSYWNLLALVATLPVFTPFLITYFCVPLAPASTSVRKCLNSNFCLASRMSFFAYDVNSFVSLITLLYKIFMRCQHSRYAY